MAGLERWSSIALAHRIERSYGTRAAAVSAAGASPQECNHIITINYGVNDIKCFLSDIDLALLNACSDDD